MPEAGFRTGRAAILQRFLEKPTLYFTIEGVEKFEAQARSNIAAEIDQLTASL